MTLFNEATLAALLEDGRYVDVMIKNFGSSPGSNYYETRFEFDGVTVVSRFATDFHDMQFCSEPDARFAFDYEKLEDAIERHFGSALHDLEVD